MSRRAAGSLLVLVLVALAGTAAAAEHRWYQTTDFYCLYEGSRSLVLGHDPYDELWWRSVTGGLYPDPQGGLSPSSCPGRFGYPLWTAVVLLPVGLLRLEVAASVWATIAIGATLAGAWAAWRAARGPRRLAPVFGILVLTSPAFWLLIVSGQITGVMLGLAGGLALLLARHRDGVAGVALAALALKPQIVILTLPVFVVRALTARRRLLATTALLTGATMLLVPMLFVFSWPAGWLEELASRRLRVVALLPTAWGLAGDAFGSVAFGTVLIAVVIATAWLLVRRAPVDDVALLALTLPLSLFVTPYAWSYDFLVLAVPWAFVLARADRARGALRTATLVAMVAFAGWLPWVLYALAFSRGGEALSAIITAGTTILVAWAIRITPVERTTPGESSPRSTG